MGRKSLCVLCLIVHLSSIFLAKLHAARHLHLGIIICFISFQISYKGASMKVVATATSDLLS